jgi:predicted transcriptional regulator
LLEVLKLISQNENCSDDLDWIAEKFTIGFQTENYDELSNLMDSLKREHLS